MLLGFLLMACGDDGGGPAKVTIERTDGFTIDVLAIRDGDGPWQPLAVDATSFDIASGRYSFAVGCTLLVDGMPVLYRNIMYSRTVDEGAVPLPCRTFDFVDDMLTHDVQVSMAEPGTISLGGDSIDGTMANWSDVLAVPAGTHALVAFDETRMLVQRDVAISAATTLPAVSLASATPFAMRSFSVSGLDGEELTWWSNYYTGRNYVWETIGDGADVPVPASQLLVAGDRREVYLTTDSRNVFILDYREETSADVELLPRLTGVTRDGRTARFGTLPDYDYLTTYGGDNDTLDFVYASKAYVEAAAAQSLVLDFGGIPGFETRLSTELLGQTFAVNVDDSDTYFRESYVTF